MTFLRIFSLSFSLLCGTLPCPIPPDSLCLVRLWSHLQHERVDGAVGGAVERALSGNLQRVHELMALQTLGAAKMQQGVADPTRPVIHQLARDG